MKKKKTGDKSSYHAIISATLTGWYESHKRDLPWRDTTDPYKIWVSEIILQQTRVNQGLDYYLRFIDQFPDIKTLAVATESEVLKVWQGLGYYSRARNMHGTAKYLMHTQKGKFPNNYAEIIELRGIGPYTAAAIASFCFNEKRPVVDGNVLRVLSRLFGIKTPVDSSAGKQKIMALAEQLISEKNPGTFNQAIMEFGALQCVPVNPACSICAFQKVCFAFSNKLVDRLPAKAGTQKVKRVWMYYFVVQHEGDNIFIRQRQKGIWKNMYDFPCVESSECISIDEAISEFTLTSKLIAKAEFMITSDVYSHVLSHRKIQARFLVFKARKTKTRLTTDLHEIAKKDFHLYAIPRLIEKFVHSSLGRKTLSDGNSIFDL